MDVTQALRDTENGLRDFIAATLERQLGREWLESCGVTPDRIAQWRERKIEEERRQEAGVVEERLLYYADFYDLKTILWKHWQGDFADALGERKRFEVFFDELARYRDPDAHRRELLPHQRHLVLGIAGDIRSRLVRWRSRRESRADCFPRIESARDSLGNQWTPSSESRMLTTGHTLRPGDQIEFVVTGRDPEDLALMYKLALFPKGPIVSDWQTSGTFSFKIKEDHIGTLSLVLRIKSPRAYHAHAHDDDFVIFFYDVIPSRT